MPLSWSERAVIGRAIREAREARGWRQQDLANKIGGRAELVSQVERGYHAYANDERNERVIKALLDALGLTLGGLK